MNKGVKVFLYIVFLTLFAGSGALLFMSLNPTTDPGTGEVETITSPEELDQTGDEDVNIGAEVVKMSKDVDLAAKRKAHKNNDIIGRLEIPSMFNVLVVKTKDNKYYLDYNIDKKKDIKGATFADYRTGVTNNQINIYGHNSRDSKLDVPFRRLEKFLKKDYFNKHPYIIFQYDGGKKVYKITAIKEVTASQNEHMKVKFSGDDFVKHVDKLVKGAMHKRDVPYDANSDIIVLQTCSHHLDNAFYIIIGVSINYVEK